MEWQDWLEKDSLDGKGANDKIKPANWVANDSDEKTENWTYIKPEDFSDIASGEALHDAHKIPKRPVEYSPPDKPVKWKKDKRGTVNTSQEKKLTTAEGEKNAKNNDMNYNRRGDELGSIERYQNKLRHGDPIPAPSLGVSGGGKGKKRQVYGHEGRHRAEAAGREGEKTIPVGIGHSVLRTGGEKKLTSRQVANLRGEKTALGQSERSIRQNVKDGMESLKSWESWLEKEDKEIKKKPTMFPRIRREFEDEKDEDPMVYDNKTASWESWLEKRSRFKPSNPLHRDIHPHNIPIKDDPYYKNVDLSVDYSQTADARAGDDEYDAIRREKIRREGYDHKKSWESWLEKNNAIETSHKKDEKKDEWDGKFSSSTIRDDVKDDDDKAVSQEESLEELTDGKLEEVEKLKSWELWLEKTINQFDKQPQKKNTIDGAGEVLDTNAGIVRGRRTETVPVPNPKGSIGKKKVKRVNHETGKKEIKYIDRENNTNSEVENTSGGRPASGKQGSINATAGGKGNVTLENSIQMLNSVLGDENKPTDKNESLPAVSSVPETPEAKRRRLIQGTYRKERNTDGSIKQSNSTVTNWESWLEKNEKWDKEEKELDKKYNNQRKGKKGKKDISAKDAKDIVRRTYDGQTPNKFMQQVNSNMAADEETQSGSRHRGDKRVPLTRVRTHTNQPLRLGGVAEDTPIGASHQSDHQLRTGRKEQYIEPKNADLWKTWLEKKTTKESNVGIRNGIPHPAARTANEIEASAQQAASTGDVNIGILNADMKKKKSWEAWIEKMQGAGDARYGNQHLTGLDQKPVNNEEDEANILPEKEEKTDNKEEKQEETDNKPYKALGGE